MYNLAIVTNDNLRIPVYFDVSEQEFFILESNKKKSVNEGLIVENQTYDYENKIKISIFEVIKNQLNLYFNKTIKERLEDCKQFDFILNYSDKKNLIISKYHDNSGLKILLSQEKKIDKIKNEINTFLGLYSKTNIKGTSISIGILLALIGKGNVITPESLLEAKSITNKNQCNFWINDKVSVAINGIKYNGHIKKFTESNICIYLEDGTTKYLNYYKANSINKSPETIVPISEKNFDFEIETDVVYAEINKIKVDDPLFSGKNETLARCVKCCNCGLLSKEKSNNYFECTLCSQAMQCVSINENIGLFIIGNKPKYYKNDIQEVKCCSNCGLSNFGTTAHGSKKIISKCGFSNKIIEPHNYCNKWIPLDIERNYKDLKRKIIKGSLLIEDKARGIGEAKPSEINEKETLKSKNVKNQLKDYNEKYSNWILKLKEKANQKDILKLN